MDELVKNFRNVPEGYGEVAFYWWIGDKLTKERLLWQLDKLKDHAISGIQINYAHTDKGGELWGLTIESDPPLFSKAWWDLFGWYMNECQKYGISLSLSDYTLGSAGQGWFVDELLENNPDRLGQILEYIDGEVRVATVKNSFSPIHLGIGDAYIDVFYRRFEEHFPGECGKGLNFFFSDELNFNVRGNLWCDDFKEQFLMRKNYDITPHLKGIFEDIGEITAKIRLDYYDVIVTLSEERFFKPVYQFHEDRTMIFGCDHGGRGKDITEFGDYFRTMKWNQGPGNDQPNLESDIIKNKVSSSIAHLYQRPRTWLEGFYGSGWGTSSSEVADATFRNFAMGHNLLTLHGLYYSTYGGWWEWAPPCNHFRMPYWMHMKEFLNCSERLSYLLSQGVHVCDVAIVYPVAAVEGDKEEGLNAVRVAFKAAEYFYTNGLDFDFIDFESILRSEIIDAELKISGESYKVLILPAMKTVRYEMLKKIFEFQQKGGIAFCIEERPIATERIGSKDEEIDVLYGSLELVDSVEGVYQKIIQTIDRDIIFRKKSDENCYYQHRRVGSKDIYFVYGIAKGDYCTFRAVGSAEVWNPWTGQMFALESLEQHRVHTTLQMPYDKDEINLIVFDSQKKSEMLPWKKRSLIEILEITGKWEFELIPTMDNRFGDFRLPASDEYIGAEARKLFYKRENRDWVQVSCGYGPRFMKMGPIQEGSDLKALEEILRLKTVITDEEVYRIGEQSYSFSEYLYLDRIGVEGDPGHQGYHGLKGIVSDEFLIMGKPQLTMTATEYLMEEEGDIYYFWTGVIAEKEDLVHIKTGELKPVKVWINGLEVNGTTIQLTLGINRILLKYKGTGRTHFILESVQNDEWQQTYPLAMSWYKKPGVYDFDVLSNWQTVIGSYQFQSPPALKELILAVLGEVELIVDGNIIRQSYETVTKNNEKCKHYIINKTKKEESHVEIKLIHHHGFYGGAAFVEPIKINCGRGFIELGDWSINDCLNSYSGGASYSKRITLSEDQLEHQLILCLGEVVSSAEVRVNDIYVGVKVAPAWEFDITEYVTKGENKIDIIVYNTLSNHYRSIPTRYRGELKSGLIGPVTIKVSGTVCLRRVSGTVNDVHSS